MKTLAVSSTCVAVWVVFATLLGVGCAEGYSATPPGAVIDALGSVPDADESSDGESQGAAGSGAGSDAGAGMSTEPEQESTPDECASGETDVCLCDATQTEGDRACIANAASSKGGYFGPCENCKPEPTAPSTTPAPGTTPPAAPTAGCTAMPTMCTGFLACCKPDGKCGVGLAPLCL